MINLHSYLSRRRNQFCHKSYLSKLHRKYSNLLNKSLNFSYINQTKIVIFKLIVFIMLFIVILMFISIWNKYSSAIHRSPTSHLYTPIDDDTTLNIKLLSTTQHNNTQWVSFGGYAGLPYYYSSVCI